MNMTLGKFTLATAVSSKGRFYTPAARSMKQPHTDSLTFDLSCNLHHKKIKEPPHLGKDILL